MFALRDTNNKGILISTGKNTLRLKKKSEIVNVVNDKMREILHKFLLEFQAFGHDSLKVNLLLESEGLIVFGFVLFLNSVDM